MEIVVKKETAITIVKEWLTDHMCANILSLNDDALPYIPARQPVRAMLAERNKAASDALWAGKQVTAAKLLMKYGLEKKDERYRREAATPSTKVKTARRAYALSVLHREAARKSNWNVCK